MVSISSWILITLATCRKLSTKDVGISNNLYDRGSFKCSIEKVRSPDLSSLDVDIRSTSFLEILEKISKKKSVQAKRVIDEIESI